MEETATDTLGVKPVLSADGAGAAFLFLVVECDRPYAPALRVALEALNLVVLGRGVARSTKQLTEGGAPGLALQIPDQRASGVHARLVKLTERWMIEDAGSKNGTFVNGARSSRAALVDGDIIQVGRSFLLFREVSGQGAGAADREVVIPRAQPSSRREGLIKTVSPELDVLLADLDLVAESSAPVLIRGETGTGKELLARTVHLRSGRAGELVAVNCGALPETLVESQLFGHKKGSFSGALDDAPGFVRAAEGGTLFLDEIGDLSLDSQAALLRVLQEREVVPIGASKAVPVDFRLVSATHHDLEALVEAGRFRSDLLARISGYTAVLPPLRARREDLGLLITSLLRRLYPAADQLTLESDVVLAMLSYDWPLNVRELEQFLRSAVALAKSEHRILAAHLSEPLRSALEQTLALAASADPTRAPPTDRDLQALPPRMGSGSTPPKRRRRRLTDADSQTRAELVRLLTEHEGNISAVARAMAKGRMQIQRWIKRYEIAASEYGR